MSHNGIILMVEDSPDDEALTLRALRKHHFVKDVVVARDGAEALDYLFATGAHSERNPNIMPRLILLDLKLPKIDGLEVLRRLRADERTTPIPVVILSSSNMRQDVMHAYRLGANGYIRKQEGFAQFSEAVDLLVRYWFFLSEPPPQRE